MLPESHVLLSLWRSLGQGAIPKREQFAPFQFPALLPYLFVLDVAHEARDFKIRLAGSALEANYGAKVLGLTIGQLELGQPKEHFLRDFALCAHEGVAVLSHQTFKVETMGPYFHERILLPFETDRAGVVGQIIGGLFFDPEYKGLSWKKALTEWREEQHETFHLSGSTPAAVMHLMDDRQCGHHGRKFQML